jgi:hypothetical protein
MPPGTLRSEQRATMSHAKSGGMTTTTPAAAAAAASPTTEARGFAGGAPAASRLLMDMDVDVDVKGGGSTDDGSCAVAGDVNARDQSYSPSPGCTSFVGAGGGGCEYVDVPPDWNGFATFATG